MKYLKSYVRPDSTYRYITTGTVYLAKTAMFLFRMAVSSSGLSQPEKDTTHPTMDLKYDSSEENLQINRYFELQLSLVMSLYRIVFNCLRYRT
jgi:hypothetical protein